MAEENAKQIETKGLNVFEKYLTVWVVLCIIGGIVLGKLAPGIAKSLDGMAIYVNKAPVVSIPIAVCLFFMMYPIMVKIDFAEVLKAGKSIKPVGLTLLSTGRSNLLLCMPLHCSSSERSFTALSAQRRLIWSRCLLVWICR